MYRSSPLRSTLNTGYIKVRTCVRVCTEAVHCVALGHWKQKNEKTLPRFSGRRQKHEPTTHGPVVMLPPVFPGAPRSVPWPPSCSRSADMRSPPCLPPEWRLGATWGEGWHAWLLARLLHLGLFGMGAASQSLGESMHGRALLTKCFECVLYLLNVFRYISKTNSCQHSALRSMKPNFQKLWLALALVIAWLLATACKKPWGSCKISHFCCPIAVLSSQISCHASFLPARWHSKRWMSTLDKKGILSISHTKRVETHTVPNNKVSKAANCPLVKLGTAPIKCWGIWCHGETPALASWKGITKSSGDGTNYSILNT